MSCYQDGVTQAEIDLAVQGEQCVCGRELDGDGECDWCRDRSPI